MNFADMNGISIHYSYLNKGANKPLIVFPTPWQLISESGITVSMILKKIIISYYTISVVMAFQA